MRNRKKKISKQRLGWLAERLNDKREVGTSVPKQIFPDESGYIRGVSDVGTVYRIKEETI